MSGQQYSVEITVGVLEKIAGLKKPSAKKPAPHLPQQQQLFNAGVSPEVVTLAKADAQLSKALQSSRRVGNLLLKQETQEVEKVKQLSEELLRKHSFPVKPVPCDAERAAAVSCYKENPEDTLKCAAQVQAYSACAGAAFNDYVKRVSSAKAA